MKIEKLTTEQITKFPEYVRKWTNIGLSTEPANRPAAEAAINRMYTIAGIKEPKIVWCGSPLSQGLTRAILQKANKASVGDSVWASVRASVWDSVGASVRASVGASVWASIFGQHEAGWLSFYDYFCRECGLVSQTEKLEGLWELCKNAGWILPHQTICWVSERHTILHRDERGRPHCDNGPSIGYPDGWNLYYWHGVRVPQKAIESPDDVTVEEIDGEQNAEVRRSLIEIVTPERYLWESKASWVDSDFEKCRKGAAPRALLRDSKGSQWLVGTDGSTKRVYYMPVPEGVKTCREAHSAICGFDESRVLAKS